MGFIKYSKSCSIRRAEAAFFQGSPRLDEPFAYLQQLEQAPSEYFWQEEQVVLQQFLQLLVLSAAIDVARPKPATMASMAETLIRVFSVFILCVCLL